MARNLNVIRPLIAGGVAAAGVAALASGVLLTPAQAADANTNGSNVANPNGQMGPMGDHGHGMHGKHMMNARYGEPVSSTRTVKQADGTIVVQQTANGSVKAVSADSITIATADSKEYVFALSADTNISREHATATVSDIVVGDWAHVSGTLANDAATADEIHAESAATHDAEVAARAAEDSQDATDDQPDATNATVAGDEDGDGQGQDSDADGDGPGGHGMGMGGGHHGKGHPMGMGDNDAMPGNGDAGAPLDGPGHSMDAHARGELISEIAVFQKADGTFVTVKEVAGDVTAISDPSVTISLADGTSATIDLTGAVVNRDHAAATFADIVVGDHVRIEGTLSGDTFSVTNVDVDSASEWAAHQAREAVEAAANTASTTSFKTTSVLKTKKTAIAKVKAAKSAKSKSAKASKSKAKKAKAKKVKTASSQKKLSKHSSHKVSA